MANYKQRTRTIIDCSYKIKTIKHMLKPVWNICYESLYNEKQVWRKARISTRQI